MVASGVTYYYHVDGLGSVTALTDSSGTAVETYRYDAFGQTKILNASGQLISTSAVGNRYMFTGREYEADQSIGLYYYRARFYSPTLGRFLQPDPIGYADSMNLYQYCGNNPVNFVDPWGLDPKGAEPKGAEPDFWDWSDFGKNTFVGVAAGAAVGGKWFKGKGAGIGAIAGGVAGAAKYAAGQLWDAGEYLYHNPIKQPYVPFDPNDFNAPPVPPCMGPGGWGPY